MASFTDPETGVIIDNCQHVLLGCCTEAADFLERIGSLKHVRFHDRLNLIDNGTRLTIEASRLPPPLHLLPSIARSPFFSRREKADLYMLLPTMMLRDAGRSETAREYMHAIGCSEELLTRLIEPIIVSALNEKPNEASGRYARMVLMESLVKTRGGYRLGVPELPQSDLIGKAAHAWLESNGCRIRLLTRVVGVHCQDGRARRIELASETTPFAHPSRETSRTPLDTYPVSSILGSDRPTPPLSSDPVSHRLGSDSSAPPLGSDPSAPPLGKGGKGGVEFDAFVAAVPPNALARLGVPAQGAERLAWRPIVSAHLIFDGPTPPFEPACVVGKPFGWVFSKNPNVGYVEVVGSAAAGLIGQSNDELLALARRSAAAVDPVFAHMPLLRGIVCRTRRATFATLAGDAHRPAAETLTPNLFLAGDWTDTGWPATIESAVRSGRAAARALLEAV